MTSFFWGQTPSLTPQGAQRKRDLANSLTMGLGAPKNVPEGLNYLGNAYIVNRLHKRADDAEKAGREQASSEASKTREMILAAITGREPKPYSSGTGPMTIHGIPPTMTPEQEIGDATMAALGKDNAMSTEGRIVKGLTDRGLPEHVAHGFIDNFRDESGLRSDINEVNPIVPGSRGGYGLAQWTGPRRKQLEAFAAQQGKQVSDLDTQLDFLVTELQGSEAKAGRSILSTRNRPEAAAAIVNDFLRPAEEHRARREANYLGAQQAPQIDLSMAYETLSNPWLAPADRASLMGLIQQVQQQNDPLRQMQLERAQIELDNLRNPQAGFSVLTDAQEIEMGLDPSGSYQRGADGKVSQIGGAGTNISVNTGGELDRFLYGSDAGLPAGWRLDRQTGTASQIPGGPAALEAAQGASKEGNKDRQAKLKLGTTLTSLGLNMNEIEDGGLPVTGAMGDFRRTNFGRFLTGSDAVDFGNRTDQITDSAAFAEIQNMRDNSPTGGAVGQLTDKERAAIGNAVTGLNNSTSAEEYTRAAKAYQKLALDLSYGEGSWQMLDDGSVIPAQQGAAPQSYSPAQPAQTSAPPVGTVEDGYRFLGGDPQDPKNWQEVN